MWWWLRKYLMDDSRCASLMFDQLPFEDEGCALLASVKGFFVHIGEGGEGGVRAGDSRDVPSGYQIWSLKHQIT